MLDKKCKLSTDELFNRLVLAKQRIPLYRLTYWPWNRILRKI